MKEKYASMILNECLRVKKGQSIFISANSERSDFVRILANEAYKIGAKDIYFDIVDVNIKHDMLKNLDIEELKNSTYFNKEKWNEYAKKGAAFVMLASETPGLMNDIDSDKQNEAFIYSQRTREEFDILRSKSNVPWCIAAVPTLSWAKEVFNSNNPVEDLWNKIFEICGVNNEDPSNELNVKLDKLVKHKNILNSLHIKKLIYKNSIGTDFSIELPKNAIWQTGREMLSNGEEILVNFPTEEIFTSPDSLSANGIVYSSKPLMYHDSLISNFWIKFKDGVAIDCGAEKGLDVLKSIINSCENSNKLGEVALVEYDSPISKSNMIFYETLYDENASCHLALGDSFPECIKNGIDMTKEELNSNNLNQCRNHVDFMIGTEDLNIKAITADSKEIDIFINGNFNKDLLE
ncbi:MAG: aminopeptidase [Bacilli bacterium]|nr:aminopeptidase [Bacilli bacterium]